MPRSGSTNRIGKLKRFLGELEMFVGFLSLSLATFLLRLETRRLGRTEGMDQTLGLLGIMTAGAVALILSRHESVLASALANHQISFTG